MSAPDPTPDDVAVLADLLVDAELDGRGEAGTLAEIATSNAQHIVATGWLARVRAEALREAADWLRDDMDEPWGMRAANRLDTRADRIEAGDPS